MVRTIQDYQLNTTKHTLADNRQSEKPEDLRTFGIGAQILSEIGVKKMRLMSAPKVFHGLAGFGLEVVDYITD
jgi:3,4-dihydroxy 2-butanone 4-phosphate synthase/GTP cyclohydrolase II